LRGAVVQFSKTNNAFDVLPGKQIFQVAIASYEQGRAISRVQSFAVTMADDGTISAGDLKTQEFNPDQDWSPNRPSVDFVADLLEATARTTTLIPSPT
jgi:hypothetical protein